jgi:DNA replication ATP-dependent helicase Dna2
VKHLVLALKAGGCDLREVGIICPFRAQVALISDLLAAALTAEDLQHCEVSTVDKYQGRDKEVVILSTVKCCLDGKESVGNLLRDWRRINVAITRYDADRFSPSIVVLALTVGLYAGRSGSWW